MPELTPEEKKEARKAQRAKKQKRNKALNQLLADKKDEPEIKALIKARELAKGAVEKIRMEMLKPKQAELRVARKALQDALVAFLPDDLKNIE